MSLWTLAAVLTLLAAVAGAFRLRSWWMAERRARTVFPASEASSLLNPLRRLKDPPRRTIESFGIPAGGHVLELGSGPGYFTGEAVRAVRTGSIVAVDLQPGMVAQLCRRLDRQLLAHVRPLVGDAMHLPVASGALDGAYVVAMLGEVPDPERAIRELARVVRPGGFVAFGETLTDPDYVRIGELRRMCDGAGLTFLGHRRHVLSYTARFAR